MARKPLPSLAPHGGKTSRWLHNHYLLQVKKEQREINVATKPLPSRILQIGDKSTSVHCCRLLRVNKFASNEDGYIRHAFVGSP